MKKLATHLVAAIALIGTPAFAADMAVKAPPLPPPAPVFSWTGCYIGGNVGGGWADKSFVEGAGSILPGISDGSHTASGWLGGGQVGCDYQFANNWVIGARGMWDAADLTGSNPGPFPALTGVFTLHTKVSSFASVVGEVGYLFTPTTKFYGKAGVAWVRDRFTCDEGCVGPSLATIVDDTRSGLDLGLGLAWMFAPNWDVFVEYDHVWLGTKTLHFPSEGGFGAFDEINKQNLNQVVVGVDYRFNFGGAPLAPVAARY
jgi:outer membrane immunogenic protein